MRAKRARGINAALWHPDIWDARVFLRLKRGFAFFLLAQLFCFFLQTGLHLRILTVPFAETLHG